MAESIVKAFPFLERGASLLVENRLYRLLTIGVVALALALTLLTPHDARRLRMPEPWSYELAARNFATGKWSLNKDELAIARTQIRLDGGQLTQYIEIAPDQWAFRQSPGHALEMAFSLKLGSLRLANIFLALAGSGVIYLLLSARFSEKAAFLGVLLFLWSPLSLLANHYYLMDTFAGGIWPLIAGGLLLWFEVQKKESPYVTIGLCLAGFATGWSFVTRQTNLLLLGVLAGYLLLVVWAKQQASSQSVEKRVLSLAATSWRYLGAFASGAVLALGILLVYNALTFGNPFTSGYLYPSIYDRHNLWNEDPLQSVPWGVSTWLAGGGILDIVATLFVHIRLWLRPATLAWPLWPFALWGLIQLFRQKPVARSSWFIFLWLFVVYAPYAGVIFFGVTRALAVPYDQGWGFFIPSRYLFPFTFPYVWVLAPLLARWLKGWSLVLVGLYMAANAWFFWQVLAR
jgi:hypothetical protein